MAEKNKIIQDISLLYELSLLVGNSMDPYDNCRQFLRTLVVRKSLDFGAIWLYSPTYPEASYTSLELFCIFPSHRAGQRYLSLPHPLETALQEEEIQMYKPEDPFFAQLLQEKGIASGAIGLIKIGRLGFLKLYAENRPAGFEVKELDQLVQVVDKLRVSLEGSFAHLRLREETRRREIAQKALETSNERFTDLFNNMYDGLVIRDKTGLVLEANAAAWRIIESEPCPTLENHPFKYIHPEDIPVVMDYAARLEKEGYLQGLEIRIVTTQGNIRYVQINSSAIYENGAFAGSRDIVRDITEQKNAQESITHAKARLETLVGNLKVGILLEDEQRTILAVNQAFCDIFGIEAGPAAIIGHNCAKASEHCKALFRDPDQFLDGIKNAVSSKKYTENERLLLTDGRIIERDSIPILTEGRYNGHLWQYRDVTEQYHAEQVIRESEEKYRGILENMELGLLEVDLDDRILRHNNAFCQLLGYENGGELIGKFAYELFLPPEGNSFMLEQVEHRKNGMAGVYEVQLVRKDGAHIWGLISGAPVRNGQGQVIGSIGILFDITGRKKLENELAEAKQTADRARMAERQFLTHMSHEIRTPINAVIGMTHLLYDTAPNDLQKEYLDSLRFSADSLLAIVDDILDLTKIDAGEIDFEQKPFDLAYLVKSLYRTFLYKVQDKPVLLLQSIDPAIQNHIVGDPTRLNQILSNLLSNAIKFTDAGQVALHVTLAEKRGQTWRIQFDIVDTGVGIPADKLDLIFQNFKQADVQVSRKYGGTGLGLTIVKQLVELQGGEITVESMPGQGSHFSFALDFSDSGIPIGSPAPVTGLEQPLPLHLLKNKHFLVVEDNLVNQKLICNTIKAWDCTYSVANHGKEAIALAAKHTFDVVLMDIHMPEMDGYETTLALRHANGNPNQHVPIIALTAVAMPEEKRRALEVGMSGFLTKPFSPNSLAGFILRALKVEAPAQASITPRQLAPKAIFDLQYLFELSNGDTFFVKDIIDTFLAEAPAILKNLDWFSAAHDWEQVGKLVHQLKSNFAMFGMEELRSQAAQIETWVKEDRKDVPLVRRWVEQLLRNADSAFATLGQQKVAL